MKHISLTELIPKEAEITINGKPYELRPFNVNDWAWAENKWGDIHYKMNNLTITDLSVILFRLLKEKQDFLPTDEDGFDDDGNKVKVRYTGPQRLAMSMIGVGDLQRATKALEACLGFDGLTDEQVAGITEEVKKKVKAKQDKVRK